MSEKHTPGPWSFYEPSEQSDIKCNARQYMPAKVFRIAGSVKNGGRYVGLIVKSHPNEPDPTEADARLIAAAPDMLEALQSCAARFDEYADHHGTKGDEKKSISNRMMANMCLDVIAKATGGAA